MVEIRCATEGEAVKRDRLMILSDRNGEFTGIGIVNVCDSGYVMSFVIRSVQLLLFGRAPP